MHSKCIHAVPIWTACTICTYKSDVWDYLGIRELRSRAVSLVIELIHEEEARGTAIDDPIRNC